MNTLTTPPAVKSSRFRRPFVMFFVAFSLVGAIGIGVAAPANAWVGLIARPLIMGIQGHFVKASATAITKNAARSGTAGGAKVMPPNATKDAITGAGGLAGASLCFEWCDDAYNWLSSEMSFDGPLMDFLKMLGGDYHALPQNTETNGTTPGVNYAPWRFFANEVVEEGTNVKVPVRLEGQMSPGIANYYVSFFYKVECEVTRDSTANTQPARTAGTKFESLYYASNQLYQTSYGNGANQVFYPTANLCTVNPAAPNNTNYYPNDSVKVIGVTTAEKVDSYHGNAPAHNTRPLNFIEWNKYGNGEALPHSMVQYQVSQECVDASGNTVTLSSVPVLGDSAGIQIPSCKEAGYEYSKKATMTYDTGSGDKTTVWESVPRSVAGAEDCNPASGGQLCDLQVHVDGKPCVIGSAVCENWTEYAQANPNAVQCLYGSNVVAIKECYMLERAYNTRPAQNNGMNTDGNPATGGPDYWQDANRSDVDWSPTESARPSNSNETTTSFPSAGSNPASEPNFQECIGAMWSWNPVQWVAVPVHCAMSKAFTPTNSNALQVQKANLENKLEIRGIQPAINAMAGLFPALSAAGGDGGCSGPRVAFEVKGVAFEAEPLNACAEPLKSLAAMSNAISSLGIVIFGGMAIIRAVGRGFGFEFGMGKD